MKKSKIPWFVLNTPELGKPFKDFYEACRKQSVLDNKTKELLMLVLACPGRVEEHIESAIDAGVSREEITEALLIAAVEAANAHLGFREDVYLKFLR